MPSFGLSPAFTNPRAYSQADKRGNGPGYPPRDTRRRSRNADSLGYLLGCVVGCGAGRVALYLQSRGLDVLGIDNSPLAVKVCKARGVKHAKLIPFTQISRRLGVFDTVVMFGNNFGLFENLTRARWLLRGLHGMTTAKARILASTLDPYQTTEPSHLVGVI